MDGSDANWLICQSFYPGCEMSSETSIPTPLDGWECAVDVHDLQAEVCKVPVSSVLFGLGSSWDSFNREDLLAAWRAGLKLWTDQVPLQLGAIYRQNYGHFRCDFLPIDRPGRTVAWSYIPCPWRPPMKQRYDTHETWSLDWSPSVGMSLPLVVAHEVGHAIGIGHGPVGNVMAPYVNNSINRLGAWDIEQVKLRYANLPTPSPEEPVMPRLWQCLISALPGLLQCLFQSQEEAKSLGEEGPIEALIKLFNSK
jgi:hypothetical protein